jgi:hypothetical protein
MFTTVGCASAEAISTTDEAVTAAPPHQVRVQACDATHDSESKRADSTLAMIEAEGHWQDCLAAANDAAIVTIEANLTQAGSGLAGSAKSTIAGTRSHAEALCEEEDKASDSFGGTLSHVEAAACRSSHERFLAKLMDAFVDFGADPVEIPEARADHASCYVPYDAAMAEAHSTADMLQALYGLAACVATEAGAFSRSIAQIEIDNDPTVGDLATSTARVQSVVHDATSPDDGLCMLLNQAGENGIGSLSHVTAGSCQGRIAESVYAELKVVVAP